MLNYLQNYHNNSLIGMLPGIINHNNEAIEAEFNWIYDSSLNRLTKSVYAPTGSVKAHFGEFVNLSCEYITIKNIDSLRNTIQTCVDEIIGEDIDKHNTLKGRWSDSNAEEDFKLSDYCHDAGSIVYKDKSTDDEGAIVTQHKSVAEVIQNIKEGSFEIVYDGSVYTLRDIAKLIDWKNQVGKVISDLTSWKDNISPEINDMTTWKNEWDEKIQDISTWKQNVDAEISSIESINTIKESINDFASWKNLLRYEHISIKGVDDTVKVYNFAYLPDSKETENIINIEMKVNELTGETSMLVNPEAYSKEPEYSQLTNTIDEKLSTLIGETTLS